MDVSIADANRVLATDLAPLIERVRDVVAQRLVEIKREQFREAFAAENEVRFFKAAESRKRRRMPVQLPEKINDEDLLLQDYWWDESCFFDLIQALRGYSLNGQAIVLERHLRRVLPDPQSAVQPTICELHEAERLAVREICQLCEKWLAPASGGEFREPPSHLIGPEDEPCDNRKLIASHDQQSISCISEGTHPHEAVPVGLNFNEESILTRLARQPDKLFTTDSFDDGRSRISQGTAKKLINRLIAIEYVARPNGSQGGAQITAIGLSAAKRIDPDLGKCKEQLVPKSRLKSAPN